MLAVRCSWLQTATPHTVYILRQPYAAAPDLTCTSNRCSTSAFSALRFPGKQAAASAAWRLRMVLMEYLGSNQTCKTLGKGYEYKTV